VRAMQTMGCANRYVIRREDNVVVVDFRKPNPPAPHFPGAGALRATAVANDDAPTATFESPYLQQRSLARA
jgi:hypothetical protein